jgi:hypothetical protein
MNGKFKEKWVIDRMYIFFSFYAFIAYRRFMPKI